MNMKKLTLAFVAVALLYGSTATAFQCNDSVDNDLNGKMDYPADPGCSSATDDLEVSTRDFGGDVKSVGNPSALPNCSPSNAGKKVYYVQGTAVGSCSVAGSAANYCACDGSSYVLLNADSMNLKLNTTDALTASQVARTDAVQSFAGTMLRMVYQGSNTSEGGFTVGGTGSTSAWTSADANTGPATIRLSAGAGTTDYSRINGGNQMIYPGTGPLLFSARVRLQNLPDGTDTFRFACGLHEYGNLSAYYSMFFEVHNGSNYWHTGTASTAATVAATTTAVAAATWYRLDIEANAAWTSVIFKVNGTPVNTSPITYTPGTTGLSPFCGIFKSAGTALRTFDIDFVQLDFVLTTPH